MFPRWEVFVLQHRGRKAEHGVWGRGTPPEEGLKVLDVAFKLRQDMDLGLRMVEGLVKMGEVGAAARLVEELQLMASDVGTRAQRTSRRGRMPRRAVVGIGVAAALGLGLSAAALVGPPQDQVSEPKVRPARSVPARVAPATEVPRPASASDVSLAVPEAPATAQAPALAADPPPGDVPDPTPTAGPVLEPPPVATPPILEPPTGIEEPLPRPTPP